MSSGLSQADSGAPGLWLGSTWDSGKNLAPPLGSCMAQPSPPPASLNDLLELLLSRGASAFPSVKWLCALFFSRSFINHSFSKYILHCTGRGGGRGAYRVRVGSELWNSRRGSVETSIREDAFNPWICVEGEFVNKTVRGVPTVAQQVKNPPSIHEDSGLICGLAWWVKDLVLLWLWHRLVATAPIGRLAWEPPYTLGVALKRQKKKQANRKKIFTDPLRFIRLWRETP